jgi:hypothetical protein
LSQGGLIFQPALIFISIAPSPNCNANSQFVYDGQLSTFSRTGRPPPDACTFGHDLFVFFEDIGCNFLSKEETGQRVCGAHIDNF